MASTVISKESVIVSTDLGFVTVDQTVVTGYDVEDIVRDKALSQARAISMLMLGKTIDPTLPTTGRTVGSLWVNNEEELA